VDAEFVHLQFSDDLYDWIEGRELPTRWRCLRLRRLSA